MFADAEQLSQLLGKLSMRPPIHRFGRNFSNKPVKSQALAVPRSSYTTGAITHTHFSDLGGYREADRLYQEYYGAIDLWAQRGSGKATGHVCVSESLVSQKK